MAQETRRVQSSDEVSVALHHLGGSGEPLLLCHATGFNGRTYTPFARRLTDRYDVWALDFRGHGATEAPTSGDFHWAGMANDVIACVDELGGPVNAFGHSMGGAALALAEVMHPGTIRSAYIFEPIIVPDGLTLGQGKNSMGVAARRRRPEFESRQAVIERYGSRPPFNMIDPDALGAYVEFGFVDTDEGAVRLACEPESEARTFEGPGKPTYSQVSALTIPLMVAAGELVGESSPAHFAQSVAAAVPGAILKQYEGMFHFGPLEDADRVAADVLEFLG